jgi:hypothetical protein
MAPPEGGHDAMNPNRGTEGRALGLGLVLVAAGGSLLVTNLVGLWLATHAAMLAPFVMGSWPMLLCATGLALMIYGAFARAARRAHREARHAR